MDMDAKTAKSELTRAAIVGSALELVRAQGFEALSLQAVADSVGLSKSGVFSRVGSREVLQKAVIEEFGRRFLAEVFAPAMQLPKGVPRLDAMVRRWIAGLRNTGGPSGCIYIPGAFEYDDREGELRDMLLREVLRWRAALRRTVLQSVEAGHLDPETDPDQLAGEIYNLALGVLHDARFLRDPSAGDRALASWQRLLKSYLK